MHAGRVGPASSVLILGFAARELLPRLFRQRTLPSRRLCMRPWLPRAPLRTRGALPLGLFFPRGEAAALRNSRSLVPHLHRLHLRRPRWTRTAQRALRPAPTPGEDARRACPHRLRLIHRTPLTATSFAGLRPWHVCLRPRLWRRRLLLTAALRQWVLGARHLSTWHVLLRPRLVRIQLLHRRTLPRRLLWERALRARRLLLRTLLRWPRLRAPDPVPLELLCARSVSARRVRLRTRLGRRRLRHSTTVPE